MSDFNEMVILFNKLESYNQKLRNGNLNEKDKEDILKLVGSLSGESDQINKLIYYFGSIIDYANLLDKGVELNKVIQYQKEDEEYIADCESNLKNNLSLREHMFGYPANMKTDSYTTKYLRYLEGKTYLMNGCGDPKEQGNYQMDNKKNELKVINLMLNNLNLDSKKYGGYITTGGTEGNIWGVKLGFCKYPKAILYASKATHYSISKAFVDKKTMCLIPSINDKVSTDALLNSIVNNYQLYGLPAVIVLNYGTTKMGAVDDIRTIKKFLVEHNIPHYIHVDAALYGGIASYEKDAPHIDFSHLDIDSISISLHKYLGLQECKGVLITKDSNKKTFIDYIGQNDTTFTGSRDFPPYSTYQKVNESLNRADVNEYIENVNYLKEKFILNNIEYWQSEDNSNIFVIEKPSDEVCLKYQLATFNENDKEYAHIIIFGYHKKNIIDELVNEIKYDKRKSKVYEKISNNQL